MAPLLGFPLAHRAQGTAEPPRQLVLRQVGGAAALLEPGAEGGNLVHIQHPPRMVSLSRRVYTGAPAGDNRGR